MIWPLLFFHRIKSYIASFQGIGLSLDEALKFWRNSFEPKIDSDQFTKQYAYSIRHNYGKEGKRADYTPYSCMKANSNFL